MKILLAFLYALNLFANSYSEFQMTMKGSLDDDLFVIKMNTSDTQLLKAYQMHNPEKRFEYSGSSVESIQIYGEVNFKETFDIGNNDIYAFMLANEREEFRPKKTLSNRTHYKSTNLNINNIILFPSMEPEKKDVPGYQTWYNDPSEVCKDKPLSPETIYSNYNYYQLWENAIVNLGFVTKKSGNISIKAYNLDGVEVYNYNGKLKKGNAIKPIIFSNIYDNINKHIYTEANGRVYVNKKEYNKKDDLEIKKNAINDIIIEIDNKKYFMELPYPMPYINNVYVLQI